MKNYNEMSDFEINKAAEKLTGMYCEDASGVYVQTCDYCNNPSDAWPVIEDMRISVMVSTGNTWMAECETGTYEQTAGVYEYVDEKPLRAAMIVFLMMQDSGHGKN